MKSFITIFASSLILTLFQAGFAQDVYKEYRQTWLKKSEEYKPELHVTKKSPVRLVEIVEDLSSYQNLGIRKLYDFKEFYQTPIKTAENDIILDFGEHVVGHVQFVIKPSIPAHAPVQLKFTFGEVPAEVHEPFSSYVGDLSKAWLQEEVVTIHTMPDTIYLPRRYSFRYIKIEHMASASDMDFYFSDFKCKAVSSAGVDIGSTMKQLSPSFDKISEVSLSTLRDCMQTVFEDGPKRDQRLWIGDLKLQALANYYSFNNIELVKRGLFLLAATANEKGLVYGTLFEKPYPHAQEHYPIDYCLLYNTILTDYYEATQDVETIESLWVIAKQQVLQIMPYLTENGLFNPSANWWYFIDWNNELDKQAALHGLVVYSLSKTWELAGILNKQDELSELPGLINLMKKAASKYYFNDKEGLFVSGNAAQISTASQAWMILAGIVSPNKGRQLFERLAENENVIHPVSPYMYHYVLEAMLLCKMNKEAKSFLEKYWGGMINKGADTFWEVYDPEDDFLSPYGSHLMNSYCHAWSCTPIYFIRKYEKELFE